MSNELTFEGVWATLQEIGKRFQESERRFQETERIIKESSLETDRKIQETDRTIKESAKETEKEFKKMMKALGDIGNRLGEFVEEMVRPAIVRLFQQRGIHVQKVHRGSTSQVLGELVEVDLLAIDGSVMVAVECKSKLSIKDVNHHIERLGKIKAAFPEYGDKALYGAVAAMITPEGVADYAYRAGIFVLAQSGDTLVVTNEDTFQPKTW